MKLKKFCAGLAALCMMTAVVPVLPVQETAIISASAEDDTEYTYENFKYKKCEDYAEITGYVKEPTGVLIIPEEIDGLPVKSIGRRAFAGCKDITSLTLPDTLTSFYFSAFVCGMAHSAVNGVQESIKDLAFSDCTGLTEINVSDKHPTFSSVDGILFNKDKTELIRYPAGKTEESYTIPDSVTKISEAAFSGLIGLTSVIIPDNVTEIGRYTFLMCTSLVSVTIPESVTSIGGSAFDGTPWLKAKQEENPLVVINHILIDATAYQYDYDMVVIPDNVKIIEKSVFSNSRSLTSVVIPENVTEIREYAFANCVNLTSVTVKNPACEIFDSANTFTNSKMAEFTGTIYGYENSTAQAYAEKYGYQFESLGSAPETTETKEFTPGDVDGSGKIDILDVITINKAILGKETLTDEQRKAIDFNGNGKPDAEDSLLLMKFIVGLITDLTA